MIRALISAAIIVFLTWPLATAKAAEQRIISIGGSVTEIIFALGAGDRLVAVDSTSLYPADATELPDVGYMRRLSAEPILALGPDRILAIEDAGPLPVLDQLHEAGVEVEIIGDDPSPSGIARKIREIASALDLRDEGNILAERITTDFERLAQEVESASACDVCHEHWSRCANGGRNWHISRGDYRLGRGRECNRRSRRL